MIPIELLLKDCSMAMRMLLKNRGATALAVVSIALGIGLTTALFGVADALIFRPASFERPEEIYTVKSRGDDQRMIGYGWRDCEDMIGTIGKSGEIVAYQRTGGILTNGTDSEMITNHIVTPNFFSMLGVKAAFGRASFAFADDGRSRVVLSHRLWLRRFGGDPAIVGKTITLNLQGYTVEGVMPASFTGLSRLVPCDVWTSTDTWLATQNGHRQRNSRSDQFEIVVRLKPGTQPVVLATQFDAALRAPGAHKPAPAGSAGTWLQSSTPGVKEKLAAGGGLLPVLILLLFVACANAAQLRLAQAESRKKEMGVRLALGSSPWGLARLLMIETALVSVVGSAAGLFLANRTMSWLGIVLTQSMGYDLGLRMDWRVCAFTLAATIATSALAGVAPVRHVLRLDVLDVLKSGEGTVRAKNRTQQLLVIGQTAASVVFFGLAVLFTLSTRNAAAVWPGFDAGKSIVLIPALQGIPVSRAIWFEQASERLRAVPGVRDVTFARRLPLSPNGGGIRLRIEAPSIAPIAAGVNMVGGKYFSIMGTRLLAGRGIGPDDRARSAPVVVVSQMLAHQIFGERNPIGESITIEGKLWQIVGLVDDAPSNNLHEETMPFVYLSSAQMSRGDLTLIVETAIEPASMVRALQQELKNFDPLVTTFDVKTLRQHVDQALFTDRVSAGSATGLGLLGFLLTAASLYGMVQYSVSRRTREIGVRMALGATSKTIQRSVLIDSLRIIIPGIAAGLVLLLVGAWYVRSSLLGISPLNPQSYALSALTAILISLVAAWLPARRAARVDPMVALRAE